MTLDKICEKTVKICGVLCEPIYLCEGKMKRCDAMEAKSFNVMIEQLKDDIDQKAPELSHLKERLNQIWFQYQNYKDNVIREMCIEEFRKNVTEVYSKNNTMPTYTTFGG